MSDITIRSYSTATHTLTLQDAVTLLLANQRGLPLHHETLHAADDLVRKAAEQIARQYEGH